MPQPQSSTVKAPQPKRYSRPVLRKLGRLGVIVQGRVGSKPEGNKTKPGKA